MDNLVPKLPLREHGYESKGSFHSNKPANHFHNSRFSNHLEYNHHKNITEGFHLGKSNAVVKPLSPSNKMVGNKRNSFKVNSRSKYDYGRGSGASREKSSSPTRSFQSKYMTNLARSNVNYGGSYTAA